MTNVRLRARKRGPRQGGQAIRRAVAVLRTLAVGGERGVPLTEIVQATSLARPTVHRIVHVLIEEGIVERSDKTGNYVVGRQVPELALARPSRSPVMVASEPHLAEAVGATRRYPVPDASHRARHALRGAPYRQLSDPGPVHRGRGAASARRQQRGRRNTRRHACRRGAQDRACQRNEIWALPRRYGDGARTRFSWPAAGATICGMSASCRERSRFRCGSGRRTVSPPRRLRCRPSATGWARVARSRWRTCWSPRHVRSRRRRGAAEPLSVARRLRNVSSASLRAGENHVELLLDDDLVVDASQTVAGRVIAERIG